MATKLTEQIAIGIGAWYDNAYEFLLNCANPQGTTTYNGTPTSWSKSTTGNVPALAPAFEALDKMFDSAANAIPNLMAPFQGVGVAIAVVFFLIQLIELAMSERMTLELFVKFFSKLIVAVAAISKADVLVKYIIDFGSAFKKMIADINVDEFFTSGSSYENTAGTMESYLKEYFKHEGAASWILIVVILLLLVAIMYVGGIIIAGLVAFYTISNLLELLIKGILLPIPLALLSDDGWRGSGGRFMKGFVGVACQRALIVFMAHVTALLMKFSMMETFSKVQNFDKNFTPTTSGSAAGEAGVVFLNLIVAAAFSICIGLAGVGAMQKSIQYSNELFGA